MTHEMQRGAIFSRKDYQKMQRAIDFLIVHIVANRRVKAVKIAQYLREQFGWKLVKDLDVSSGHVKSGRQLLKSF